MALDLSLKTRKRAVDKESEPLDMSVKHKPPPIITTSLVPEGEEVVSPSTKVHFETEDQLKQYAIANWTWSKYKTCKRKLQEWENDTENTPPKRLSPDIPR